MGFVEHFYTLMVEHFESIQASQFGVVASGFAQTGQIVATLTVVMTLIAAASGRGMAWADALKLCFLVTLVGMFMQNWAHFNSIVNSLISLFDGMRDSFFRNVGANGDSFLGKLDDTLSEASAGATKAAGRLDVAGSVQNAFVLFVFGALAALSLLGMVFSYALLTISISFAPIAIMCLLTQRTRNYFEKWLDFTISSLMFPVIIAAILGTAIYMMQDAFTLDTDEPTAGLFFPVVASVITSIMLLIASPFILTSLTGSLSLGALGALGAASVATGAVKAIKGMSKGTRTMTADTTNYAKNQRNFGQAQFDVASRSAKLMRAQERQARLSKPRT